MIKNSNEQLELIKTGSVSDCLNMSELIEEPGQCLFNFSLNSEAEQAFHGFDPLEPKGIVDNLYGEVDRPYFDTFNNQELYSSSKYGLPKELQEEDNNSIVFRFDEHLYDMEKEESSGNPKDFCSPKNQLSGVKTWIEVNHFEAVEESKQAKDTEMVKTSSNKALALRADVMNKNFFRALRRECKTLFEDYLSENLLPHSRNKRVFKTNLKKYATMLLTNTEVGNNLRHDLNHEDFEKYLGIFINTCIMKKKMDKTDDEEKVTLFNEVLYSYSHKKFKDYLMIKEVSAVLQITLERCPIDTFMSHNPALAANATEYSSHIKNVLAGLSL